MLIQSTEELKDEFPFKLDMNDGKPIGIGEYFIIVCGLIWADLGIFIGWSQFTVDAHGARSSAATAYIAKTGTNVHVLVNTHVKRVLPTHNNHTDFRTVEFAQTPQSERRIITVKKEVILSGGVIGTPRILLNSGIRSRRELEELGIETLVGNPSVGKNLTDHPLVQIAFETTIPDTE
jgi:choline dehydrogenase-like flavoprotein